MKDNITDPGCNYIVTWGDDGHEIHGPFETDAHLTAYASFWQFVENYDDPNWNVSRLDDAHAAPEVIAPPSGDLWTKIIADYRAANHVGWPERTDGGPRYNYLILFPQDADGDHVGYQLVGPFDNEEGLSAYGHYWEGQDSERHDIWHSLYIADPKAAPRVTKPNPHRWPEIWRHHEIETARERGPVRFLLDVSDEATVGDRSDSLCWPKCFIPSGTRANVSMQSMPRMLTAVLGTH
jgi:hypothetical protein